MLFALIGRVPEHEPAAAEGWRVVPLLGKVYPALVPGDAIASGYLLTGLTVDEWRVLDAFEDPVYELRRLELADGRFGWAYLGPDGTEVGDADWSMDTFESDHLAAYAGRCIAWRERYDQAAEQAS